MIRNPYKPKKRIVRKVPQRAMQARAPQPDRDLPQAKKPQTTYRNNTGQPKQGASFGLQRSAAGDIKSKSPLDSLYERVSAPTFGGVSKPDPPPRQPGMYERFQPGPRNFNQPFPTGGRNFNQPMPYQSIPRPWGMPGVPQAPAAPAGPPPVNPNYPRSNTLVGDGTETFREGTIRPAANGGQAQLVRVGSGYDDVAWTTTPVGYRGTIAVIDQSGGQLQAQDYTYGDAYGAITYGRDDPNNYGGSDVGNVRNYVNSPEEAAQGFTYNAPEGYGVLPAQPFVPPQGAQMVQGPHPMGQIPYQNVVPGQQNFNQPLPPQGAQNFNQPNPYQAPQGQAPQNRPPTLGGRVQDAMGGPTPSPGKAPAPQPGEPTLPLDPAFEAGRRALDDQLSATLAGLGASRGEIDATLALVMARLEQDRAEALRQTNEAANARGVYDSGIRFEDLGDVYSGYQRQQQDLAADMARQVRGLSTTESQARADYGRGIAELLADLAARSAANGLGGATSKPNPPARRKKTSRKRRGKAKRKGNR